MHTIATAAVRISLPKFAQISAFVPHFGAWHIGWNLASQWLPRGYAIVLGSNSDSPFRGQYDDDNHSVNMVLPPSSAIAPRLAEISLACSVQQGSDGSYPAPMATCAVADARLFRC